MNMTVTEGTSRRRDQIGVDIALDDRLGEKAMICLDKFLGQGRAATPRVTPGSLDDSMGASGFAALVELDKLVRPTEPGAASSHLVQFLRSEIARRQREGTNGTQ